jgi:DNA-binding XRE family transcriptional regulator
VSDNPPEPNPPDVDSPAASALAAEIRRRRKLAGLSHTELATRIGYSRQYISRAERPRRGPASADLVRAIDTALHAEGALTELHAHALAERQARRTTPQPAGRTANGAPNTDVATPGRPQPTSVASTGARPAAAAPIETHGGLSDGAVDPVNRNEFLRVMAAAFTGMAATATPTAMASVLADPRWDPTASPSWAAGIYRAVLNPTEHLRRWAAASDNSRARKPALRPLVDQVMTRSLAADYGRLSEFLPDLLGHAEYEALHAHDPEQAHAALADVYSVIGWILIKADNPLGAWIAAQRATDAAEHARDPIRVAAATRCLAEVHMRGGNHEKATRTALLATTWLDNPPTTHDPRLAVSVRGAALLSAAAASARNGERREAEATLRAAGHCADQLGHDSYDLATVFGPTNVAIHQVAIAIELGDAPTALRHASTVDIDHLPPMLAERKARFLLDVARAEIGLADYAAALNTLIRAETISPDEVHHHRITRQLIPQLVTRERRGSGLREFAHRCNIHL